MNALTAGTGLAIVLGIGALCIGFAMWEDDTYRPRLKDLVDEALDPVTGPLIWAGSEAEADHETCRSDDCDLVLCYCRDQDGPCDGTEEPGCNHRPGEFVCEVHRYFECLDCRHDARVDTGCRS